MNINQGQGNQTLMLNGLHPPLVYIFRVGCVLCEEDLEKIKDDLRRQFSEGLVLIDSTLEFLGCFGTEVVGL